MSGTAKSRSERWTSMDTPAMEREPQEQVAGASATGTGVGKAMWGCWKARESLWVGLIVLLLGVVGQILLGVVPSEDFMTYMSYGEYQLISALGVCAEAATYLGVVWVGVYLARWGLRSKKG